MYLDILNYIYKTSYLYIQRYIKECLVCIRNCFAVQALYWIKKKKHNKCFISNMYKRLTAQCPTNDTYCLSHTTKCFTMKDTDQFQGQ